VNTALGKETSVEYTSQPMRVVLSDIAKRHGIKIAVPETADWRDEPVSLFARYITLRSALGALLYKHHLRCKQDGDGLAVFRP